MLKRSQMIFLLVYLLFFGTACQTHKHFVHCHLGGSFVVDPEFELGNFSAFINTETGKPLTTLILDTQRIYSPDYNYYFEFQPQKRDGKTKAILFNSNGKKIATVKQLHVRPSIKWLKNCVIFFSNQKEHKINLETGRVKKYDEYMSYLGQLDDTAYYDVSSRDNKFEGFPRNYSNSIFAFSDNGVSPASGISKYRQNAPDSIYSCDFFNSQVALHSINLQKMTYDKPTYKIEISVNNKIVQTSYPYLSFDSYRDSYYSDGATYLKINDNEIYRVKNNTFEKLFTFGEVNVSGWIREFKVEGDFLIFVAQNQSYEISSKNLDSLITVNGLVAKERDYAFHTLGIINLKTKECFYPTITK
jgi:hypothetical protein